jgi:DnaJ-class molecular chaperone
MTCKSVRWYKRNERPRPGPHQVECGACGGDGIVGGSCSCGRCESPPDVWCPECDGIGYVDEQTCEECGEYPDDCTCKQEVTP